MLSPNTPKKVRRQTTNVPGILNTRAPPYKNHAPIRDTAQHPTISTIIMEVEIGGDMGLRAKKSARVGAASAQPLQRSHKDLQNFIKNIGRETPKKK